MKANSKSGHGVDKDLIERRLRAAYGYAISESEIKHVSKMHALSEESKIVKHAGHGVHPRNQFDGDYLSGGEEGYVLDVCGDYAQVRWKNGSVRFYYVGRSPFRPDAAGNDTKNPRALRCLALVSNG